MDRRTFVRASISAGASAAVALPATTAVAAVDRTEWESALAAYRLADDQLEAFDVSHYKPIGERMCQVRATLPCRPTNWTAEHRAVYDEISAIYDPVEKRIDELVAVRAHALDDVLLCPAPDIEAVLVKLRFSISEAAWENADFLDVMHQMVDDLVHTQRGAPT